MANTVTVDNKTLQTILSRLDKLTKDVEAIKTKIVSEDPPYGSDEWWEWSDKKALEEVKKGNYKEISSVEELKKVFKA